MHLFKKRRCTAHKEAECKLECVIGDIIIFAFMLLLSHLYGRGFGVHDFLVHSDRHHDGVDFAELIFCFLQKQIHKKDALVIKRTHTKKYGHIILRCFYDVHCPLLFWGGKLWQTDTHTHIYT